MTNASLNLVAVEAAAKAIFDVRDDEFDLDEWEDLDATQRERYECDARAALAAYRGAVHSLVNTVEKLKALPDGTVLRVKNEELAETGTMRDGTRVVWSEGWTDLNDPDIEEYFLPARVLHLPEADDA